MAAEARRAREEAKRSSTFGGKLQTTPEEFIAWAVARRVGKPVKYTETRSESLMSGHHGRDQWQKLTLSAERDGTVTGFKVELLADLAAGKKMLKVYRQMKMYNDPTLNPYLYNRAQKKAA